eukprot:TRINITY_DN3801_c0_g1_i2.p2 TRINITY_DN3801_c0_g1~~TRINITY_DN3801_c0_g1_i2.p2  ORF type:complete len:110 (+),score=34.40 TRINITY_DN3801_c0_g1_i2:547-876(+)
MPNKKKQIERQEPEPPKNLEEESWKKYLATLTLQQVTDFYLSNQMKVAEYEREQKLIFGDEDAIRDMTSAEMAELIDKNSQKLLNLQKLKVELQFRASSKHEEENCTIS